jgi:hypothetical protein
MPLLPLAVVAALILLEAPLWAVAAVAITAQHWLGPVLVYRNQRFPRRRSLLPCHPGALPEWSAEYLARAQAELAAAGFGEGVCFVQPPERPGDTEAAGALFEPAGGGDLALAVVMRSTGPAAQRTTMLQFRSEWSDGSETITANSASPSVFPRVPRVDGLAIPELERAAALYEAHRLRVAERAPARPRPASRGADPLGYETAANTRILDDVAGAGYFRLVGADYRPTLRGALLMTWRLLAPLKQLTRRESRRRAAPLVARLGV